MTTCDVIVPRVLPPVRAYQPWVARGVSETDAPVPAASRLGEAFQRREDDAFDQAYRRYAPSVAAFVRAVVGVGQAEDVTHEVFIEAWRRADEYRPERASLGGWLMMIARSRAIDHYRRQRRRGDQVEITTELPDQGPSDIDALHATWGFAVLLADLDPVDRRLMALRFQQGLSQSQIAEHTGMPLGTVKTRMTRALAGLRGRMDQFGEAR